MIDSDYGFCHVLFVFKRTFLFYPLLRYNVLAKEDFCIMDTNQKRILNIEKDWSESQKTFAALKLIEQLNKDKLLKGIEFKRILQNYITSLLALYQGIFIGNSIKGTVAICIIATVPLWWRRIFYRRTPGRDTRLTI